MKSKLLAALVISASALFAVVGAQAQDNEIPPDQAQVENNPQQYPQQDDQQQGPEQYPQGQQNDQQEGQNQGQDTNAGVARVSMMHGDVSTQRGDSGGWSAAVLNAPIVSGDKVSTGDKSRAEVQLDFANVLRLGANAQATVAGLTRNSIQVQISQGLVNYDVFKNTEAAAEIDTPNVAIRPSNREGSYRIEVRPNGETEVVVRKGDVDISTPQGNTHLNAGQDAIVRGTSTDAQYKTADAPPRDDWDRWNSDRNNMIQNAQSWNHTDRYYTGSEDLDTYGHWGNIPDYGPVWYPSVSVGWAPYRAGRWVWEPYWGWTWVSYEPWGWAPYHYGRWFEYGGAWAWWPGPVGVGVGFGYPYRPIWAPAYVSFFGFGGRGGFGFGFGSVGWLPIGPCDPFFPWWGGFRGRFTVVDFHHFNDFHRFGGFRPLHGGERFSNLRLAATDQRFRRSISAMDAHHFGTGGFRARGISEGEFRNARMMGGNLPVVPTHASLSASNRAANRSTIHNGAPSHFFGNRPTARTASFSHEASQMRQNIDRSGGHFTQASANNNRGFENRAGENNAAHSGFENHGAENNTGSRGGFANNGSHNNNVPRPGNSSFENRANENHSTFGNGNNIPRPNAGMQTNHNPEVNHGPNENNGFHSFSRNSTNNENRPIGTNVPANNGSFNHSQPMQGNSSMRTNNIPRPSNSTMPQNTDRGGWQHFTPQPRSNESSGRSFGNNGSFGDRSGNDRGGSNDRFGNQSTGNRSYNPSMGNRSYGNSSVNDRSYGGYSRGNEGYSRPSYGGGNSRPPLNMRQPVVTQRSASPSYGGGGSRSGYSSGGSGGYHGGGGGGGYHGGGGGSAPHGGGGGGHAGGGGGGGHSGGGHR